MPAGLRVAVVGATGAVGKEMLRVFEQRRFPIAELLPFASPRSRGKQIPFGGKTYSCHVLEEGCFRGVELAFFDASDEVSRQWALHAAESGAWVVDNSAAYRLDPETPLIVPEVNGHQLHLHLQSARAPKQKIIAGPNCTTVQLVVALKPLALKWGLKRVVVSTYQAVSGAGTAAMGELRDQAAAVLAGREPKPRIFSHPIAFNCIPQIGSFSEDGYTSEEHKVMSETRKILDLPGLPVVVTAIRVPTLDCHGEAVFVELERDAKLEAVRELWQGSLGVELVDVPAERQYPMGFWAAGHDPVYIGRVRRDPSVDHGLSFWVVSDNLRKGAALNAVQIGEQIISQIKR